MVNSLRLGLSKFDEVITPEVEKIKKAQLVAEKSHDNLNPSMQSSHSKSPSISDPAD
jgi:hypothetical protein